MCASIKPVQMEIALEHFAVRGREVDLPNFSRVARMAKFLRPEPNLPARAVVAMFEPELGVCEFDVLEQLVVCRGFNGFVRIELQFFTRQFLVRAGDRLEQTRRALDRHFLAGTELYFGR